MRAEYDNLMESSPSIDLDVITMFNKKFEGKYKNVRRPVIVNGLREIKPFKMDDNNCHQTHIKKIETIEEVVETPKIETEAETDNIIIDIVDKVVEDVEDQSK
jgi:hypothetical protein